jgi:5'-phosphate synthase pdxT subunit
VRIGVLAVQGAFVEHIVSLHRLDVEALAVRLSPELAGLDGLIIPGGESTTISKLMQDYDLRGTIRNLADNGLPIFGTCAGMILLASNTPDLEIEPLGLMKIVVRRNAFGRQVDSFETALSIPVLGQEPFPGIFIRAPLIEQVNSEVDVLAKLANGTCVAARQGKLLACAFHPELTDDLRFHQYFISILTGN